MKEQTQSAEWGRKCRAPATDQATWDINGACPTTTKPPLLHVGYIRTVTTYLQHFVFNREDAGLGLPGGVRNRARIVHEIILADDYTFDPESIRARLRKLENLLRKRNILPVWSEEILLGNPLNRRYDGHTNARKLRAVFPNAKILITIREQMSIVLSMYREYVRHGGTCRLSSFIGTGNEYMSFTPILRQEFLYFDRSISFYRELFGPESVLVLPQELLSQSPIDYFHRLSDFVGAKLDYTEEPHTNSGQGLVTVRVRRAFNGIVVRNPLKPGLHGLALQQDHAARLIDRLMPRFADRALVRRYANQIETRYRHVYEESNRRTAEMTGLPLKGLGYAC